MISLGNHISESGIGIEENGPRRAPRCQNLQEEDRYQVARGDISTRLDDIKSMIMMMMRTRGNFKNKHSYSTMVNGERKNRQPSWFGN